MTVKYRPIVLSAREVQAILEKKQSQLRRPVIPQPERVEKSGDVSVTPGVICPIASLGNILWCREDMFIMPPGLSHEGFRNWAKDPKGNVRQLAPVVFISDAEWKAVKDLKLRVTSASKLPQWATRISLRVTSIRLEQLQDVTEADALLEGFVPRTQMFPSMHVDAKNALFHEWNQSRPKEVSYHTNPWTWVLAFEQVEDRINHQRW
jgi:hypothetical protein